MKRNLFASTLACSLLATTTALASDWSAGPSLNTPRAGCAVAIDPNCTIIVTGGRLSWTADPINGTASNEVEVLNVRNEPFAKWITLDKKPMIARREFHAMAIVNGFAYVFGGSNSFTTGTVYLDSAERLDLLDPDAVWEPIAPMPTARNICGAVVDDYGRIYVIGGSNAPNASLATVERYDPARDIWETLPSLSEGRGRPGVAKDFHGRIYVIGGGINGGALASVERFNPNNPGAGWQNVESIPEALVLSQAVTVCTGADGRIYMPTGIPVSGPAVSRTARYDPKEDEWEPWVSAPVAVAPDSNASVTDCNGNMWLIGAHTGSPTAETYYLSGACGAGEVRPRLVDVNADDKIDIDDLLNVISGWGNCP